MKRLALTSRQGVGSGDVRPRGGARCKVSKARFVSTGDSVRLVPPVSRWPAETWGKSRTLRLLLTKTKWFIVPGILSPAP